MENEIKLALTVEDAIKFKVPMAKLRVLGLDGVAYVPEKVILLYEGSDKPVYRFQTVLREDTPLEAQSLFIRKSPEDIVFATVSKVEIHLCCAVDCLLDFQDNISYTGFLEIEQSCYIANLITSIFRKIHERKV